jgi:hypothetical protein
MTQCFVQAFGWLLSEKFFYFHWLNQHSSSGPVFITWLEVSCKPVLLFLESISRKQGLYWEIIKAICYVLSMSKCMICIWFFWSVIASLGEISSSDVLLLLGNHFIISRKASTKIIVQNRSSHQSIWQITLFVDWHILIVNETLPMWVNHLHPHHSNQIIMSPQMKSIFLFSSLFPFKYLSILKLPYLILWFFCLQLH